MQTSKLMDTLLTIKPSEELKKAIASELEKEDDDELFRRRIELNSKYSKENSSKV